MKHITAKKLVKKNASNENNDDNVRYKLSKQFYNNIAKTSLKASKYIEDNDDSIRYKFASVPAKPKAAEKKPKQKPKIKVNFWSNKQVIPRSQKDKSVSEKSNRRHTVSTINEVSYKKKTAVVKAPKQVSFLPTPYFTENHAPMVTVPDDLTIQINSDQTTGLFDGYLGFTDNKTDKKESLEHSKKKTSTSMAQSPRGSKQASNDIQSRNQGNENELEFFSKYVVQKLRRMETNQRIYSENLINTVLMLGQLSELNGKSKITNV